MRGFTYLEDQTWWERNVTRGGGDGLPISLKQARTVTEWLKRNWGDKIEAATRDTAFPPHIVAAITCQETAYFWLPLVGKMKPNDVLGRCVLDASGDYPGNPRSAFPRNSSIFRDRYGDEFADMLIEEANKTRALRNYDAKDWVYKGYGIFQYDLQAVVEDETFFHEKQWYDIDHSVGRMMLELKRKWARTHDLWAAVKAYNGSGSRAQQYMENVRQFADVTEEIWDKAPGPDPVKPPVPVAPAHPAPKPPAPQEPVVAVAPAPQAMPTAVQPAPIQPVPSPLPQPAPALPPQVQPAAVAPAVAATVGAAAAAVTAVQGLPPPAVAPKPPDEPVPAGDGHPPMV